MAGNNKKRRPQNKAGAGRSNANNSQSSGGAKRQQREAAQRQAEIKRKGSWAVLFGGVAVVVAIIVFAVVSSVSSANEGVADANDWELPSLYEGEDVTLASLRGNPVVLNFFASWCTACEAELPEFKAAAEQYGDSVEFVFIDSQDSDRLGREMAERFGIDGLTVVKDFGASNQAMFREMGGVGMPITAFYDADGTLRFISPGAMVNGALVDALTQFGYI